MAVRQTGARLGSPAVDALHTFRIRAPSVGQAGRKGLGRRSKSACSITLSFVGSNLRIQRSREIDPKCGAYPNGTFDADKTGGRTHKAIDLGKPKAGSLARLLGRKEGFEDAFYRLRRHPDAGVRYGDQRVCAR